MAEFDDKGRISVWAKKEGASESAPHLSGNFTAHRDIKAGEKIDVSIWKNENYVKGSNQPWGRGKIRDRVERGAPPAASPPPAAPEQPDFDDAIPF